MKSDLKFLLRGLKTKNSECTSIFEKETSGGGKNIFHSEKRETGW